MDSFSLQHSFNASEVYNVDTQDSVYQSGKERLRTRNSHPPGDLLRSGTDLSGTHTGRRNFAKGTSTRFYSLHLRIICCADPHCVSVTKKSKYRFSIF